MHFIIEITFRSSGDDALYVAHDDMKLLSTYDQDKAKKIATVEDAKHEAEALARQFTNCRFKVKRVL